MLEKLIVFVSSFFF